MATDEHGLTRIYICFMAPEEEARAEIDKLLGGAGWSVQSREHVDLTAVFAALRKRRQLGQGEGRQADPGTQLFPDFPQIEALSPLYKINDGAVVAFIV